MRRADFLHSEQPLEVRVAARGVRISLQVSAGLEITGRVFDVKTNESQAGAVDSARWTWTPSDIGARTECETKSSSTETTAPA